MLEIRRAGHRKAHYSDTYRAGGEIDEADSADNAGLWVIWEEDGD